MPFLDECDVHKASIAAGAKSMGDTLATLFESATLSTLNDQALREGEAGKLIHLGVSVVTVPSTTPATAAKQVRDGLSVIQNAFIWLEVAGQRVRRLPLGFCPSPAPSVSGQILLASAADNVAIGVQNSGWPIQQQALAFKPGSKLKGRIVAGVAFTLEEQVDLLVSVYTQALVPEDVV